MVKVNVCFKGNDEPCIYLIFTNRKYSCKRILYFETGLSDNCQLIHSTLSADLRKNKLKNAYRNFKHAQKEK